MKVRVNGVVTDITAIEPSECEASSADSELETPEFLHEMALLVEEDARFSRARAVLADHLRRFGVSFGADADRDYNEVQAGKILGNRVGLMKALVDAELLSVERTEFGHPVAWTLRR